MAIDQTARRRERPWWRSRRLVTVVVLADLVGLALLAYALVGQQSAPPSGAATTSAQHTRLNDGRPPSDSSKAVLRARPQVVEPATGVQHGSAGTASAQHNAQARRTPATHPKVAPPTLGAGARTSFAQLQARLGGQATISLAIQPVGHGSLQVLGADPPMQGMSTTKILVLSALLRDRGGLNHLTAAQRSLAQSAITESDNQSILDLFAVLESDQGGLVGASSYLTSLLRDAGDPSTTVATAPPPAGYATTFGQTQWRPSDEVTFFRSLASGCLLPEADTSYVLGLMTSIEPSESWGLGAAGFSGVAFKGGWGPEPGGAYGVRQTGIIGTGSHAVVAAVTADLATTFPVGTSVLTQVAQWLRHEVVLRSRETAPCPS